MLVIKLLSLLFLSSTVLSLRLSKRQQYGSNRLGCRKQQPFPAEGAASKDSTSQELPQRPAPTRPAVRPTRTSESTSDDISSSAKPRPSTRPEPEEPKKPADSSQTDLSEFATAALEAHNAERAKRQADPVAWSDELATAAQAWTDKCVFEHGGGKPVDAGENLSAGNSDITAAIASWIDEAKNYKESNPTFGTKTGHWTQVVWKETFEIGCSVSECAQGIRDGSGNSVPAPLYACEYRKAGNMKGAFADNVSL